MSCDNTYGRGGREEEFLGRTQKSDGLTKQVVMYYRVKRMYGWKVTKIAKLEPREECERDLPD